MPRHVIGAGSSPRFGSPSATAAPRAPHRHRSAPARRAARAGKRQHWGGPRASKRRALQPAGSLNGHHIERRRALSGIRVDAGGIAGRAALLARGHGAGLYRVLCAGWSENPRAPRRNQPAPLRRLAGPQKRFDGGRTRRAAGWCRPQAGLGGAQLAAIPWGTAGFALHVPGRAHGAGIVDLNHVLRAADAAAGTPGHGHGPILRPRRPLGKGYRLVGRTVTSHARSLQSPPGLPARVPCSPA